MNEIEKMLEQLVMTLGAEGLTAFRQSAERILDLVCSLQKGESEKECVWRVHEWDGDGYPKRCYTTCGWNTDIGRPRGFCSECGGKIKIVEDSLSATFEKRTNGGVTKGSTDEQQITINLPPNKVARADIIGYLPPEAQRINNAIFTKPMSNLEIFEVLDNIKHTIIKYEHHLERNRELIRRAFIFASGSNMSDAEADEMVLEFNKVNK